MSRYSTIKVHASCRNAVEAFRREAADVAGPKGHVGLPNGRWWQEASLSEVIEWLALLGQQHCYNITLRAARRKARIARRVKSEPGSNGASAERPPSGEGEPECRPQEPEQD